MYVEGGRQSYLVGVITSAALFTLCTVLITAWPPGSGRAGLTSAEPPEPSRSSRDGVNDRGRVGRGLCGIIPSSEILMTTWELESSLDLDLYRENRSELTEWATFCVSRSRLDRRRGKNRDTRQYNTILQRLGLVVLAVNGLGEGGPAGFVSLY